MTGIRRDEFPLQSSLSQLGLNLSVELLHLLFQDLICGCHVRPTIRREATDAWTPGVEAYNGVDKRSGVQFVYELTMY